jgi:predicted ferric reductase
MSIAVLVLVWRHIRRLDAFLLSCLTISASLFLAQKVIWVIMAVRRNRSSGTVPRLDIRRFPRSGLHQPVIQIRFDIKTPWVAKPGHYIYLTLPRLRSLGLGALESHPFMISWTLEDVQTQVKTVILLIQVGRGFTHRLQFANPLGSVIIDGPYGGHEVDTMIRYDKVLLLSSGIGIAAHLEYARYLILAHNTKKARVRRLTVVWKLDTLSRFIAVKLCGQNPG